MSKVCAKVMYLTASEERKYKGNGPKVQTGQWVTTICTFANN